ncbi:MAG: LPS ABC transporter substrate-binding protein LptA [Proteobacteria bacterium]|nr:LPS ABC transporter substrate-binding protein LptA [Pseudomonadota bacterium]
MRPWQPRARSLALAAGAALLCLGAWRDAVAQAPGGPPNALQGFSQNREQPVSIESTTLEVREKSKIATFTGNVRLVQGDTTLTCMTLIVHYAAGLTTSTPAATATASASPAAASAPAGNQSIRRIEAKGNVRIVQKDQTAVGDNGVFDMASNTVTLTGNVTMTQGADVVQGDKLWVDLTSGRSRVESGASSGVRALIKSNTARDRKAEQPPATRAPAAAPAARAAPSPPAVSANSPRVRPFGLY